MTARALSSLDDVRTVVWGEQLPDFRFDPHAREPGAVLYVRDDWRRRATSLRSRVTVRFPGRIHLGMLDPAATPRIGSHGYGGGIGVSVDALRSRAAVWVTKRAPEDGGRDPIELHYLRLFQELVGGVFDCDVRLDPRMLRHAGLGSSAAVGVALLAGLNELCGAPFTDEELTNIYLLNYVEAAGANKVIHAITTGVAAATLRGGLVGIDAGSSRVQRMTSDGLYASVAIVARPRRQSTPTVAPITFRSGLARQLSAAMAAGDRAAVLRICRSCADQNTRRVATCFGLSSTTARLLSIAKGSLADVVGVTSDGPSVFALSSSKAHAQALAAVWRKTAAPEHVVVSTIGTALSRS